MNDFMTGLVISILGLLITFTALGFFILTMVVLKKIFPYKDEDIPEKQVEPILVEVQTEDEDRMLVAAITAAVLAIRMKEQTGLGDHLLEQRGRWWAANLTKTWQKNNLRVR